MLVYHIDNKLRLQSDSEHFLNEGMAAWEFSLVARSACCQVIEVQLTHFIKTALRNHNGRYAQLASSDQFLSDLNGCIETRRKQSEPALDEDLGE